MDKAPAETDRFATADAQAPPIVRRIALIALTVLTAGALYLVAVRRDAILTDLANFTAWCF